MLPWSWSSSLLQDIIDSPDFEVKQLASWPDQILDQIFTFPWILACANLKISSTFSSMIKPSPWQIPILGHLMLGGRGGGISPTGKVWGRWMSSMQQAWQFWNFCGDSTAERNNLHSHDYPITWFLSALPWLDGIKLSLMFWTYILTYRYLLTESLWAFRWLYTLVPG